METVNSLQLEKGRENLMIPRRNVFAEDAQLTNAPTKLRKEEYVSNMVLR